ncbi:MAG TPA: DUF3943 domain-containing protein [Polyangiaceae bacterium]|nr:DUF3943 domain-containing protein [Polyangiaceae bacterium]
MKSIAALCVAGMLVAGSAHAADEPEPGSGPIWGPPVAHSLALFTGMRLTEAVLWPEPFARVEPAFWWARYEDAYTLPPKFDPQRAWFEWDGDPWTVNVIGHGLLGSELYLRARNCRFGWAGSLAFAAGGSLVWEYVFEANGVRPSAQDLIYTPLIGFGLGEARFAASRALRDARGFGAVLRVVLDPFGEAERALGSVC